MCSTSCTCTSRLHVASYQFIMQMNALKRTWAWKSFRPLQKKYIAAAPWTSGVQADHVHLSLLSLTHSPHRTSWLQGSMPCRRSSCTACTARPPCSTPCCGPARSSSHMGSSCCHCKPRCPGTSVGRQQPSGQVRQLQASFGASTMPTSHRHTLCKLAGWFLTAMQQNGNSVVGPSELLDSPLCHTSWAVCTCH